MELAKAPGRVALLVDDSPTDVIVIKEALERSGVDLAARVVKDGEEALHYLRQIDGDEKLACPALVLLDLNLPKVAGIDVLRELRGISRCRNAPVIVVTSSIAEADRVAAQRLGANGYFHKPNDLAAIDDLARLIRKILAVGDSETGTL